jgi:subfamily B ATP-binding cassette protein MsbA
MERIYGVLDADAKIVSSANAVEPGRLSGRLKFDAVDFAYPDGTTALSGISFEAKPGETIAFVGRSGAGKTTVFNLLPRLYDVTGGRIELDGNDLRDLDVDGVRRNLALVSQDSLLLTGTVADNLKAGREDATDDEVIAAAKAASAHDFIMELPKGYDTRITPENHGFSGGQRQRLSIARAMLRDAPILMLDEPTSALDAASEGIVRASLGRLSEGRTTLVIAHRLATILSADQILVMEAGRVIERGTHSELVALNGVYAQLYRMQFDDAQESAQ